MENEIHVQHQTQILICDCGSHEHQLVIDRYEDFLDGYIIIKIHLVNYRNIFKRAWVAIKYIFGYKCKDGNWDSLIITKQNYQPLKEAIAFLDNE